ncbi:MAG: tRNA epoxyqueuosine(34) reductase QueG [Gemmatimonadaceae bacterium]
MSAEAVATISIENLIKAQAYGLGFDRAGIAALGPMETSPSFDAWVDRGYAGQMDYLPRGAEKRRDSRTVFPGAASAIVVALNYGGREPGGPVARYARGDDYHDVMTARLGELHRWLAGELGYAVNGKAYVDTGPILERDLARRAGLGWFGKNTNLINPDIGSFFFLGALFVDIELIPDAPFEADRCGTCTRCLDACPTNAFVEPHMLDATRCISYLTIENKGAIPEEMRDSIGGLLYGCDICQEVCPWNVRFSRDLSEPTFQPRAIIAQTQTRDLAGAILGMNEETYRELFRGSAMKRAKRRGLARNAAVVLGNVGDERDLAALTEARSDPDAVVREHVEWALARIAARTKPRTSESERDYSRPLLAIE